MKVWFDTEFIEDGRTIELVSIGIIREDDATYYAEVEGVDLSRGDDWFQENVVPHLTGVTKHPADIAADIVAFVGEAPEFWAYYGAYDWVVLCRLFGRMVDLPEGWPMFCRDLKQSVTEIGNPQLPKQTSAEHNALDDAVWTKAAWTFVEALKRRRAVKHYADDINTGMQSAADIALRMGSEHNMLWNDNIEPDRNMIARDTCYRVREKILKEMAS